MTYEQAGLPLQGMQTVKLLSQIMPSKDMWSRKDLAKEVEEIHLSGGGLLGIQSTIILVKKSLTDMRREGFVSQRLKGFWEWSKKDDLGTTAPEVAEITTEEVIEEEFVQPPKYKTLGSGSEAVYVYFNPSDAEIAKLKGETKWACKVGRTATLPVEARIIAQNIKTAFSRHPEIGLVILTDNCQLMEKIIHSGLEYISAKMVESIGCEWFVTNPEKIADWFESFEVSINKLRG